MTHSNASLYTFLALRILLPVKPAEVHPFPSMESDVGIPVPKVKVNCCRTISITYRFSLPPDILYFGFYKLVLTEESFCREVKIAFRITLG